MDLYNGGKRMRFFDIFSRFLISIVVMIGMFIVYDIYLISLLANARLLDKFVVNIILKDNSDVENLINNIRSNVRVIKFKEIEFIDKQKLFEQIKQKEEFNMILSILKENPFYDIIRIKFEEFSTKEISYLLNDLRNNTDVKQIIYDYNLKTYLQRLEKFRKIYEIVCIALVSLDVLILIFNFFSLDRNSYILNIPNIAFIVFFSIISAFNKEVINKLSFSNIIGNSAFDYIILGLIYLVGISQNIITTEEGKDTSDE